MSYYGLNAWRRYQKESREADERFLEAWEHFKRLPPIEQAGNVVLVVVGSAMVLAFYVGVAAIGYVVGTVAAG